MNKIKNFFKTIFATNNKDEKLIVEVSKEYRCIDDSCCNLLRRGTIYYGFEENDGMALNVADESKTMNIYSIGRFIPCQY